MPSRSNIAHRVHAHVRASPTSVAVIDGDTKITYDQLWRAVTAIRRDLDDAGVPVQGRVGVSMDKSWRTVAAMLAIVSHGGCYVPLDPAYPTARLEHITRDSGILFVCVDARPDIALSPDLRVIEIDDTLASSGRDPASRSPESPCYIIYTSGSTGAPKGVQIPDSAVESLLSSTARLFDFTADDVWTWFHSYSFDFAVWEIWGALVSGACVVVVPPTATRNPAEMLTLLQTAGVTILNQVPSAFRYLAKAYARNPERLSLRHVIFGGEALDRAAVTTWRDASPTPPSFTNMYGITETTVHATFRTVSTEDLAATGPTRIGEALSHLAIEVVVDGRPAPPGVTGELWISGSGLSTGYLNREALTAERFPVADLGSGPRRWYRSGDLGRRQDGALEYLGRMDQQINLRGYRIELGEVEAAIQRCPGVADVLVTMAEVVGTEAMLVAHVVPEPDHDSGGAWLDTVKATCRAWLPSYMTPNRYLVVDALPVTPSGKRDRRTTSTATPTDLPGHPGEGDRR